MNYKVIDKETYYRKGVFRHFTEDCACSTSMTARIDVTDLVHHSKETGTKFYINFLYILSKVLNSREDYRMGYLKETNELICYDVINPIQYIFHEDTETFTLVYTEYDEDYEKFYKTALRDAEEAKKTREYGFDIMNHPSMSYAEKNRALYLKQKQTLDLFLERGAITKAQHDKSLHDLTVKMRAAVS